MLAVVAVTLLALCAWMWHYERDNRRANKKMLDEVNAMLRRRVDEEREQRGKRTDSHL